MMRRLLAAILATFACTVSAANADYRSEYRDYAAAIKSADFEGALEHGEKAWKAGETELGDDRLTAILAFNYANVVYEFDPSKALPAFERALALVESGVSDLDRADVSLGLAAARFATDVSKKPDREQLEESLKAAEGRPLTYIYADAWRQLALTSLAAKKTTRRSKRQERLSMRRKELRRSPNVFWPTLMQQKESPAQRSGRARTKD